MSQIVRIFTLFLLTVAMIAAATGTGQAGADQSRLGYYRSPAIHHQAIVFVAEGDLWKVGLEGGIAQRLTSHPGAESYPAISPDGRSVAFSATYEGPTEAYVMPLDGGLPVRLTFFGDGVRVAGWTPQGDVICAARHFSTLPRSQLVTVNPTTIDCQRIPLDQASEGTYDDNGTLFFTRFPFQGSYTKRYKGGTAQNLWKFQPGAEAVPLTVDFAGTSRWPMWYDGRLYFVSDRDGWLNLWSMNAAGADLKQHTFHVKWDVKSPSLSNGKIVYQLGAGLRLYDIITDTDREIPITLASDFDQMRQKWVDNPVDYVTAANLSPDGDRVVLTARGQVFVAPVAAGRLIQATHDDGVRYLGGVFMPDGKSVLALSDVSGEHEFCKIPANGVGKPEQLSDNGTVFRSDALPSPDGKLVAYTDKNQKLWIFDLAAKRHQFVDSSEGWGVGGLAWSPDSRWLAYSDNAGNLLSRIFVYEVGSRTITPVTTERFEDVSPAWSPDGKWLYFLSDRHLSSIVLSAWETEQPFPCLDKKTRIYMIPLVKDLRSPFEPENEVSKGAGSSSANEGESTDSLVVVKIDLDNIAERIMEVPVPPGNYGSLTVADNQLFWLSWSIADRGNKSLMVLEIKNKDIEPVALTDGADSYQLSGDRKKMLLRKGNDFYVVDAGCSPLSDLSKNVVPLSGWKFALNPSLEWRQMFIDAWRMERDYFYDPGMHGVDWKKVLDKYLPLVDRITDRDELSDLIEEMVGEVSALHIYVAGGDSRKGPDAIQPASFGAVLTRDEAGGGFRVDYIYKTDPDEPNIMSPLARPGVSLKSGDIIQSINGVAALSVPYPNVLLRDQAGKQVLLSVKEADTRETRDVIVEPMSSREARDLRYRDWEYGCRLKVEQESKNEIGYVHLRAMSQDDYGQWVRDFYPVIDRQGLIVDVRHNEGGNIDSWILTTLLRRPWAWWQSRAGDPYPNMQISFGGHIVVLVNEWTASDGELFAEGFRRLGLGKTIGTRTWGGEIWLSYSNVLVDRGIASAAESGVYGPEGEWLIEGHGFVPDITVDNLPYETYNGRDAQLEAAIEYLKEQIRLHPVEAPKAPPYPDKSFKPGK